MNILHVLDSCGMYGKENVVKSLLDTIGGKALNLSDITTFEQSVKEDQLISSTESKIGKLRSYINANEDGLVHCHDFKSGILSLYYKYFGFKKTKIIRTFMVGQMLINYLKDIYIRFLIN